MGAQHKRAREKLFFDGFRVIIIQLDAQTELIFDEKVCKNFNFNGTFAASRDINRQRIELTPRFIECFPID